MRLTLRAIAAAAAGLIVATPAAAQVALEANAARAEGNWGVEVGGGYTLLEIGGFQMTPSVGVFLHDKGDDRFGFDPTDEQRCRDLASGETVDGDLCDPTGTELYGRVEATYTLPLAGVSLGTGARFTGDSLRPYGTVSMPLLPRVKIKANAGPKYYAAGLSARF